MRPIKYEEYVARLNALIPRCYDPKKDMVIFEPEHLLDGCTMGECIVDEMWDFLKKFQEVDAVEDLKDSCVNLNVLVRFLKNAFTAIYEEGMSA